jgi:hypothetical protein
VVRPVALIAAAIQVANPSLSDSTAKRYAEVIRVEAREHDYDPFTGIAIMWHETRVRAGAVGGTGGRCYGLAQICVQAIYPYCRGPGFESAQCQARRSALLVPEENIRVMSDLITRWRAHCRRKTGLPALFHRWLSGFQGVDAATGGTCGMKKGRRGWRDLPKHRITTRVMEYRKKLIHEAPRKLRASRSGP